MNRHYSIKKTLQIFGSNLDAAVVERGVGKSLPDFSRSFSGHRKLKSWSAKEISVVGTHIGFLGRPKNPVVVSIFVTKGGVLKTTLTLNLARMAALHGIRTCVVGLDMQADVTSALGFDFGAEEESIESALEKIGTVHGLADVFSGTSKLQDVLQPTDLPTLFFIAETPELVALDQSLINKNRREYWLKETIVEPLKSEFDLIILDCSPNWNRLITNSLTACDVLVSPVECKINNFRNLKIFKELLQEFRKDLQLRFDHIFVPTRLSPGRKLSQEIFQWYREHLENCTATAIRESVQGEEASAVHLSIPEYTPMSVAADEVRELLREIWSRISVMAPSPSPAIGMSPTSRVASDLTN